MDDDSLLNASDGNPVRFNRLPVTESPFLLIGDHAGSAIPASLGDLGLAAEDRRRHIALDLGVRELGEALGERLQAPFVRQHFSRLVCDCNRHPGDPEWAPAISDGTPIPGNRHLTEKDTQARRAAIFEPYHAAIAAALEARAAKGAPTILVSLHSFTPNMSGEQRPWDIGILHDGREDAYALDVLKYLRGVEGLCIGDNQPYEMDDTDYTVPRHAYPLGLPYIEVEVRQDHLADEAGIERMAQVLGESLTAVLP
ncbi:N-formylglutamate amidohydrolase [Aurantiacibacter zhengii]|uniref:N-formylglutamate amidohydrolase n=1 Tax=Aurantiacibacter zhengii TaxID=2307003 RepID=A0A418NUM7_9SPHN|nr:N-formylglutamate amidohydrolase [Aurantiacibacter zhengii]RIV87721.1 N-formylglutamate amidohydrolase [Aurantiacibacter zhengii]